MSQHDLKWDDAVVAVAHTKIFSPEEEASGWPERMTPRQLAILQCPYAEGDGPGQAKAEKRYQRILQACARGMLAFTAAGRNKRENEPPSISPEEFAMWLTSKAEKPTPHVAAWLASQPLRSAVRTTNSNLSEATRRAMGLGTHSEPDTDAHPAPQESEPATPSGGAGQSVAGGTTEEAAVASRAGIDVPTRPGLPSSDIAYCFHGVLWTEAQWKKNLSDRSKWLNVAVMTEGVRGKHEIMWDPLLLGVALARRKDVQLHQVRARFQVRQHLAPYKEAWNLVEAEEFGEL